MKIFFLLLGIPFISVWANVGDSITYTFGHTDGRELEITKQEYTIISEEGARIKIQSHMHTRTGTYSSIVIATASDIVSKEQSLKVVENCHDYKGSFEFVGSVPACKIWLADYKPSKLKNKDGYIWVAEIPILGLVRMEMLTGEMLEVTDFVWK